MLIRKGVNPSEYMDTWNKFDEVLLSNKDEFYSSSNMEDITDADYKHAKRVYNEFNPNDLGDYHNLYV